MDRGQNACDAVSVTIARAEPPGCNTPHVPAPCTTQSVGTRVMLSRRARSVVFLISFSGKPSRDALDRFRHVRAKLLGDRHLEEYHPSRTAGPPRRAAPTYPCVGAALRGGPAWPSPKTGSAFFCCSPYPVRKRSEPGPEFIHFPWPTRHPGRGSTFQRVMHVFSHLLSRARRCDRG